MSDRPTAELIELLRARHAKDLARLHRLPKTHVKNMTRLHCPECNSTFNYFNRTRGEQVCRRCPCVWKVCDPIPKRLPPQCLPRQKPDSRQLELISATQIPVKASPSGRSARARRYSRRKAQRRRRTSPKRGMPKHMPNIDELRAELESKLDRAPIPTQG